MEYAWLCLNKQDSEYGLGPKYAQVLNMAGLLMCKRSEYAIIFLERVLNTSWVLNMLVFWIWQGFEYARVIQCSKYATIRLLISEQDLNMPEYVWIHDNRQGSEYVP